MISTSSDEVVITQSTEQSQTAPAAATACAYAYGKHCYLLCDQDMTCETADSLQQGTISLAIGTDDGAVYTVADSPISFLGNSTSTHDLSLPIIIALIEKQSCST